jgi:hypothetical protein
VSKIRDSAKGQQCQVRIIGVCTGDSSTVVWAHANGLASGRGMGMKANDLSGAYACQACHDCYDRRIKPKGITYEQIELDFYAGHLRSLDILIQKGLVKF